MTARCRRCGETKPLEHFYRDRSRKNGRKSLCKECDLAGCRAYYAANSERVIARVIAQRKTNHTERNT